MKSNIITAIAVFILGATTAFLISFKTRKVVQTYVGTPTTNEVVIPYNIFVIEGCRYVEVRGSICHMGNCPNHK